MKRILLAAVAAVFCLAPAANAQADFTATAIMLTMANMNQPPPAPDADTGDYSKFHKVALLSALNGSVPFDGEGKDGRIDISAWDVNAQVAALLRKRLAGRFEFVDVNVDAAALARNANRQSTTKAFLKTLPNPGVDAYIVVRPVDGGYSEPGIALRTGWEAGDATLFVNYEIDVIDAHRFSVVGSAEARLRTRETQAAFYPAHAIEDIDKAALIAGKDPEALDRVHRALTWSLQMTAVETLRALEIGVELPPVGDHGIAVPQRAPQMAQYRNIGVASALGDDLRVFESGHMFVTKKNVIVPGAVAGFDAEVEKTASEVLARHHTVKPVTLDRAALAKLEIPLSGKLQPIAGLPASNEVDAYVLFLKAPIAEGEPNQGGVMLIHWIPMGDKTLSLTANMGVAVIDAKTGKVLTSTTVQPGPKYPCEQIATFPMGMSRCPLNEKKFTPADPAAPSEATMAEVRAKLEKIVADAIPEALFAVGLDSPAPEETAAAPAAAAAPMSDTAAPLPPANPAPK